MQVIKWEKFILDGFNSAGLNHEKPVSMTVGIFDGVHLGHQALIKKIVSHNADYTPVIITFRENHKLEYKAQKDIQDFPQRLQMFENLGIQITVVINFTDNFRKMPGQEFLEIIYSKGNIGYFAIGGNFRCGCGLDTSAEEIKKFFASRDIPAEIADEVMEGLLPVSSSRIRAAIKNNDIELAEKMLGRKHSI